MAGRKLPPAQAWRSSTTKRPMETVAAERRTIIVPRMGLSARSSRGGQGLAARPVVTVELAPRVDGDADGRLRANRLDVVPAILGPEDEIARARVDGAGLALDVPVDLTLEHDPPL